MRILRIVAVAAVLGFVSGALSGRPASADAVADVAAASPWVELHASRARLVASHGKTASGARLAGIELILDDGWKTYWRMPGDAGVPPQIEWSGSTNAASVSVLYPAPMRMREAGAEVIGYKHAVLFPVAVTPEDPAKPTTLKLTMELGICREICVPVTANLDVTLPPDGRVAGKTAGKDAIEAALERVPRPQAGRRPTDPELRQVSVDGGRLTVTAAFHGGESADVFVEAPDGLYVPMLRKEAGDADGLVRFVTDLPGDLVHDLKGKTLTLTLVSDAGASNAQWTVQ